MSPDVDHAHQNIAAFVSELGQRGCVAQFTDMGPVDEGRWRFEGVVDGRSTSVLMPRLPVQDNVWQFPRLVVNGSSWVWPIAVSILARE